MTGQYFLVVDQLYIVCSFALYRIVILRGNHLIVCKGGDTLFAGGYMFWVNDC